MKRDETILKVEGLAKHFPVRKGVFSRVSGHVRAVDGVDLEIAEGRTVGLVGESGSGKTTLGKTALRLLSPTAGRILFRGRDITALGFSQLRVLRREMQIIFQNPYGSLNPRMNVGSLVSEGIGVHGTVEKRFRRAFVDQLLGEVGLGADAASRYPHEFSGGQRQRNSHSARHVASPEARGLRRTRLRPGRVRAGPDNKPAQGPPAPPRPFLPVHIARPARREARKRRRGRDVPGKDSRDGGKRGDILRAPCIPTPGF